ncbi:MAG TPA: putative baseplate assembly protein [Gemmatimonadales bacterium]|jgi:hypothetical protein
MNGDVLVCREETRRAAVRAASLNGLDYVEVSDDQLTLTVYFLGKAPAAIDARNVRIRGGVRVTDIHVVAIEVHRVQDPDLDDSMDVTVDRPGDSSTYQLCLVQRDEQRRPTDRPLEGFDVRYACVEFSFKAGCPSDLDCGQQPVCPPTPYPKPEITYLAKDYASFRQLMLDRLSLIMPDWTERHVPDLGIALVEALAYVGDHLSYYQDAVATEAYLDTARRRISVRRHARLVDYAMHEGCNARAWVRVGTTVDLPPLPPDQVFFITDFDGAPRRDMVLSSDDLLDVPPSAYEVFEPLPLHPGQPFELRAAHSSISIHTWGNQQCCLAGGATTATLRDQWGTEGAGEGRERRLHLQVGDVVIFAEVLGPTTGIPADADPTHRHAVRLTAVHTSEDPLSGLPVVEIAWGPEDALPFPLCLSSIGQPPDCAPLSDVTVVWGNAILVDHGRTVVPPQDLGPVPTDTVPGTCEPCGDEQEGSVPAPFAPRLAQIPLTFAQPVPGPIQRPVIRPAPAAGLLSQDPRQALPRARLWSTPTAGDGEDALFTPTDLEDPTALARALAAPATDTQRALHGLLSPATLKLLAAYDGSGSLPAELRAALLDDLRLLRGVWIPVRDLLASGPRDAHFVVEIDDDGYAHIRFGDGEAGRRPTAGTRFTANYRVGNGPAGNVAAESIVYLVIRGERISGASLQVENPFAAAGGTAAETLADVRMFAPHAFRSDRQRAITAGDYATLAERNVALQGAAAALDWTGSWYEARVGVDPRGSETADEALRDTMRDDLERYRRIGHDLVVAPAEYVSLELALDVCVQPHVLRGHVKAALLDAFSNRRLADGRLGFFHPDRLTFGKGIYVSALVAAAQAEGGVQSVTVTRLARQFGGDGDDTLQLGVLRLGSLEVARLDNDPSFPEHGTLTLTLSGGR